MSSLESVQPIGWNDDELHAGQRAAEAELRRLIKTLGGLTKGTPGIRGENRPASRNKAGESARRTYQRAVQTGHITLDKFAELLAVNRDLSPQREFELLSDYVEALHARDFIQQLRLLRTVLTRSGRRVQQPIPHLRGAVHIEWEFGDISPSPLRDAQAWRDISERQDLMARSDQEIGWIIDVRDGVTFTAPSRLACLLVGMPPEMLHGASLLDFDMFARGFEMFANAGEIALVDALFTRMVRRFWSAPETIARADALLSQLGAFVRQNRQAVLNQITVGSEAVAEAIPRDILYAALSAVVTDRELPVYTFSQWNASHFNIGNHPLLAPGAVARFLKKARPLPTAARPVAFETTFAPYNEEAWELVQSMRRALPAAEG